MEKPSLEDFLKDWRPVPGTTNPEKIESAFCEWMTLRFLRRTDSDTRACAYSGRKEIDTEEKYGPFDGYAPVWCFDRFGRTSTPLPDGRIIHISGEHEDHYDPDFCIYNDVTVESPDGKVTLYRYPESDFEPTDFHSATLVGNEIIIIGNLGYPKQRACSTTPIYSLSTDTLRIRRLDSAGVLPGWISRHTAILSDDGRKITVRDGVRFITDDKGTGSLIPNFDEYELELETLLWRKTSDRSDWSCYRIDSDDTMSVLQRPMDDWIPLKPPDYAAPSLFIFESTPQEENEEEKKVHTLTHGKTRIKVTEEFVGACTIVFQGRLSPETREAYLKIIQDATSAIYGISYTLDRVIEA